MRDLSRKGSSRYSYKFSLREKHSSCLCLLYLYVFQFSCCSSLLNPLNSDCVKQLLTALLKDLGKAARIHTFIAISYWKNSHVELGLGILFNRNNVKEEKKNQLNKTVNAKNVVCQYLTQALKSSPQNLSLFQRSIMVIRIDWRYFFLYWFLW